MNIKEIKEILQLMADHGLNEIEIEKDGMKIKLKKGPTGKIIQESLGEEFSPRMASLRGSGDAMQPGVVAQSRNAQESPDIAVIKSPMVGTFYSAPAPDQPPYAPVGIKVKEGEVLCIVEAMKLMNEIKCEMSGTVVEVLVKNGQPVEFDQALFKIRKD